MEKADGTYGSIIVEPERYWNQRKSWSKTYRDKTTGR